MNHVEVDSGDVLAVLRRGCERDVCYDEDLSAQRTSRLWNFAFLPQIKDNGQTNKKKKRGRKTTTAVWTDTLNKEGLTITHFSLSLSYSSDLL